MLKAKNKLSALFVSCAVSGTLLGISTSAYSISPDAIRDPVLFSSNTLLANDDDSSGAVPIGFSINFYGNTYDQLYVNNNGNVTFDSELYEFTPFELSASERVMLAPFFADVDTRHPQSGLVQYGQNTIDSRNVFGVNWIDVGYYYESVDKLNRFQLVLFDRSDVNQGDFDFEFNYGQIQWETGDASDGVNGLGGFSARVGWSDGGENTFELQGSGVNGAFLDGGPNALIDSSLNSDIPGRYVFSVRGSQIGAHNDFNESLSKTGRAVNSALRHTELVMNGIHSRPLSRLVEDGKMIVWGAGDWGRDDHKSRSGKIGATEFGVGKNLGAMQLNGAIGHIWNNQKLPLGGEIKHRNPYLLAEGIFSLSNTDTQDLYLTLTGMYSKGDTTLTRGYVINLDQLDRSSGKADLEIFSLRSRIDWANFYKDQNLALTPYGQISYSSIKLDGYTETGGSFPARFNARKLESTDLTLGVDGVRHLNESVQLLAKAEVIHRLDSKRPGTQGDLLTVSEFNYASEGYDRTWGRFGLGAESSVFGGRGSVMLNATTKSDASNYWLALNWQKSF